jgi:adenylate cyclase, class 2
MAQIIEKEAKFYIQDLKQLEKRIIDLGGELVQPRTFETNLRFDTQDGNLTNTFQVLRLRQDTRARMTYKGPADPNSSVSTRPEYEVEISDLDTARAILEALGYQVITVYEKYRAAYDLEGVEVSLDEMPFGYFSEIEGPDEALIKTAAHRLNLKWENRSALSYMRLFTLVKTKLNLPLRDLTFEKFSDLEIQPQHLQLSYAD